MFWCLRCQPIFQYWLVLWLGSFKRFGPQEGWGGGGGGHGLHLSDPHGLVLPGVCTGLGFRRAFSALTDHDQSPLGVCGGDLTSLDWQPKHQAYPPPPREISPRSASPPPGINSTCPRGGGWIARVFQGKLWYPPLMQSNRTQVKQLE